MLQRLIGTMLSGWIVVSLAISAEPKVIEPFTLPDVKGKPYSPLSDSKLKGLVVVFIGTECPINNAYMPRLNELYRKFQSQGVGLVGINANEHDTTEKIAWHVQKFEIAFPVLKDHRHIIADRFGAERVPEAFLLNARGEIVYRGRIDDQFGIGYKRNAPTRADLVKAVDELLAGQPISVPRTEAPGCLISRLDPRETSRTGEVTYNQQVAAILERRCVECHRAGEIGPMSLRRYEDAVAWAGPIQEAITEGRMPPWHAGPEFGPFLNDRRLTKDERETLLKWIEQGCPQGEGSPPPPREFVEGWTIGKPDLVFEMPETAEIPAETPPRGIPYRYYVVETNFTEDKWVQAAQTRPGARDVVHHIIVFVLPPGQRRLGGEGGLGNGFLVAYAPGDMPFVAPPGMAKKIPKGSRLVFQMHYTPNGKAQKDRSIVGLVFAKEPPQHEVKVKAIATRSFAIPPGAENHQVIASTTFRRDTLLLSFSPHMHLRGKDFCYHAIFPDGTRKTLLAVPRYDFNWQTTYQLAEPLKLPAGTRIQCVAHYDNSSKNPNNPDPNKTVRWGDQTWEEMMIGFVDYVDLGTSR